MVLPGQADELEKQGRLLKGTRKEIARVGHGVVVRKGSAKPDLSSVDGLKRTLLGANSISYGDPAAGRPLRLLRDGIDRSPGTHGRGEAEDGG